jgi:hypothetical protein
LRAELTNTQTQKGSLSLLSFFRPRLKRAFLLVLSPRYQLEVEISGFSNVAAHFKRMQDCPSIKKLLAYEKKVNEGFAKKA